MLNMPEMLEVVDCDEVDERTRGQKSSRMKKEEFLEKIEEGKAVYLRDWHLVKEKGEFYEVPECFVPDWMDEYQREKRGDDFRFVYVGGRGSWTPQHTDVLATHSWSINIVGRKHWVFWENKEGEFDAKKNYEASECYFKERGRFPEASLECVQEEGDGMFVPCNWFHTVKNMEKMVVSVNQNWSNGSNGKEQARLIVEGIGDVEEEIGHLRSEMEEEEWSETVQRLLRANLGMNVEDFIEYVKGHEEEGAITKYLETLLEEREKK